MHSAIATRTLVAESNDGVRFTVVLRIGAPEQAPDESWVCTASVEGLSRRSLDTHGADSLQAMLLALKNVRVQLEHFVKGGGRLYLPGDEESGPMSVAELFSDGV